MLTLIVSIGKSSQVYLTGNKYYPRIQLQLLYSVWSQVEVSKFSVDLAVKLVVLALGSLGSVHATLKHLPDILDRYHSVTEKLDRKITFH